MKNVLPYLLGAQEVHAHQGNIRLKCTWNRTERRDKHDGTVVHRTVRDALGNTAQTRDNRRRFEFARNIFEHENLTCEVFIQQKGVKCSAQRRRIAKPRARVLISAVQTPFDNAAPLLRRKLSENILHFPVLQRIDIENGQICVHVLFQFPAKYRLIVHDAPSFLMRLTSYG